jgi:hypothetical protein
VRIVFFKVVVRPDLFFLGTRIGKQQFAITASAKGKLFLAHRIILDQGMVEDVSAFAEGTFDQAFRHYLPR